jgi:hypothetical protein
VGKKPILFKDYLLVHLLEKERQGYKSDALTWKVSFNEEKFPTEKKESKNKKKRKLQQKKCNTYNIPFPIPKDYI